MKPRIPVKAPINRAARIVLIVNPHPWLKLAKAIMDEDWAAILECELKKVE